MRTPFYGVGLLDDLHTYFPDLLYNPERFTTVASVLRYIRDQTESQFNLFARGQRDYSYAHSNFTTPTRRPQPQVPLAPARPPISTRMESVHLSTPPAAALGSLNIDNVITETYDLSSLFQLPAVQRLPSAGNSSLLSMLMGEIMNMPRADMEPVQVRPDAQTIEQTTRLRPATAADESDTCSICQDTYTEGQAIRSLTHCSHRFHKSCIDQWFEQNVHCPVCRFDIRETPAPSE